MFVGAEIKLHVIYIAEEKIDLYCPSTTIPKPAVRFTSFPSYFYGWNLNNEQNQNFLSSFLWHQFKLDLKQNENLTNWKDFEGTPNWISTIPCDSFDTFSVVFI